MKHICFHSNVLFRSSIFWGHCLRLSAALLENCGHCEEGRVDHSMSEIQMFLTKVTPCCDAIKTQLKVIQNASNANGGIYFTLSVSLWHTKHKFTFLDVRYLGTV